VDDAAQLGALLQVLQSEAQNMPVIFPVHPQALQQALHRLLSGTWKQGSIPPLWDGHAASRIIGHLLSLFAVPKV
jgi:UDP-N-acetylglucosamine 2-epimerase